MLPKKPQHFDVKMVDNFKTLLCLILSDNISTASIMPKHCYSVVWQIQNYILLRISLHIFVNIKWLPKQFDLFNEWKYSIATESHMVWIY